MKTDDDNCFSCAFQTLFEFTGLIGFPAISLQCYHRNKSDKISVSKFHYIAGLLISMLLFSVGVYFYLVIYKAYKEDINPLKWMSTLIVLLLCCRYFQTITIALWNTKFIKSALRSTDLMFKNWKLMTGESLLPIKTINLLQQKSILSITIAIVAPSTYIIYVLNVKFVNKLALLEQLVCGYVFYIDLLIAFGCKLTFQVFILSAKHFHEHLKKYLSEYVMSQHEENTLERYVSRATRLHLSFIFIFRNMEKFMNPNFVFWLISTTVILIVNSFLILTTILSYDEVPAGFVIMEMQIFGSNYFLWDIVSLIQELDYLSNEMLSFLFKYPISKLTHSEASQIEMLITALNLHRPILKASDIFIVRTKLLPSLAGTIVTYVMVALQFHNTWTTKYTERSLDNVTISM